MIFQLFVFITKDSSESATLFHERISETFEEMANSATDDFIEMSTSTKTQKHDRQSPFIFETRAPNLFFFSRDVVRTPGKYVYAFTA